MIIQVDFEHSSREINLYMLHNYSNTNTSINLDNSDGANLMRSLLSNLWLERRLLTARLLVKWLFPGFPSPAQ